ncbi:MAG: Holliday junction resolvase RuvX [Nocardioidaceae bacterium]
MQSTEGDGGTQPRRGRRLGVDVGDVRIGIAVSDPDALLATPVETVQRGRGDVRRIVDLAVEQAVIEVVVGQPRSLSGALGPSARKVEEFVAGLMGEISEREMSVSVRMVDERLTTVSAERVLRERGKKGARRRAVVDQAAAVVILQHALDAERSTGQPPGHEVRRKS